MDNKNQRAEEMILTVLSHLKFLREGSETELSTITYQQSNYLHHLLFELEHEIMKRKMKNKELKKNGLK